MSLMIVTALLLSGSIYEETFDQGNAAYEQGDYQAAVDAYEQLIESGVVSAAVFHNLGNAYYRCGRLGAAIANYERAIDIDTGRENARANLSTCVRQTERQMARPRPPDWERSLLFWHYDLSPRASRRAAVVFWLALWGLLALRLVRPSGHLTRAAVVAAILAAALGGSAWVKAHGDLYAVADAGEAPVHYGTSDEETVRFYLYAGDRVVVDRREQGWARVRTADGERGWVRDEVLAFVGPPYERPAPRRDATDGATASPASAK